MSTAATIDFAAPDVYFTPGYGAAEQAAGAGAWAVFSAHEGRWQLPLHIRDQDNVIDAVSPYGYSGAYCHPSISPVESQRIWASLFDELRQRGVVSIFLRQSPLVPTTLPRGDVRVITDRHPTVFLQLTDEEKLWANMEGRSRTSIRKARKLGLRGRLRPVEATDFESSTPGFRALYEETMVRVGASQRYFFSDDYFATLLDRLGAELSISEVEDDNGRVLASALFMRHGSTLHYHLSGSTPQAARQGATNLLIWQAAEWGRTSGANGLHLGGGVGTDDSLFKFKRSFGGDLQVFSTFGLVVDPHEFARATRSCEESSNEQEDDLPFFPPFRRPRA